MKTYTLIRSNRRTLSLSVERDGTVLVRAPLRMPQKDIDRFVLSHENWIKLHSERVQQRLDFEKKHFSSPEQIAALTAQAKRILPQKTEYWAKCMGVTPTGIRITSAKTRFGSCSAKDSICYSCRLMAYPEETWDYVVVHELSHILHKNHSREFYACIARFLPDWKRREALLRMKTDEQEI